MTTTLRVLWWCILIPSAASFVYHIRLFAQHRRRGEAVPSYVKSSVMSALTMTSLASAYLIGIDTRAGMVAVLVGGVAVVIALVQSVRYLRARRRKMT